AVRRIVRAHGPAAARAAVAEAAGSAARRLDEAVFGPVRPWLGDGELVLVPVGALHATPWALLPACRGRPVAVAPSASAWLAGDGASAAGAGFGRMRARPTQPGASAAGAGFGRRRARPTQPGTPATPMPAGRPVLVAGPGLAHAE